MIVVITSLLKLKLYKCKFNVDLLCVCLGCLVLNDILLTSNNK